MKIDLKKDIIIKKNDLSVSDQFLYTRLVLEHLNKNPEIKPSKYSGRDTIILTMSAKPYMDCKKVLISVTENKNSYRFNLQRVGEKNDF